MVAWKRQMRVDSEMCAGAHLNDFNCHLDAPRFFISNIERRTRHVRRSLSRDAILCPPRPDSFFKKFFNPDMSCPL